MNIRAKLDSLKAAINYAGNKGWTRSRNPKTAEKNTEDVMTWASLYKWIADIRSETSSYMVDKDIDYRNLIAILHKDLNDHMDKVHDMYRKYFSDVPELPILPNGAYEPEAQKAYMLGYKIGIDALLYSIGVLYNRIKLIKKIMVDKGYDVPNIPYFTLLKIQEAFQHCPSDLISLD